MPNSVLVAYASRYGSTKETAEQVATMLRKSGRTVDVQPARQVRTLEDYDAVILGVPLYIGQWLKDIRRFLTRHQQSLTKRSVALFTLGPTRETKGEWQEVRQQMGKQLAKYPWLKPVAVELFGGKYDPDALRCPDSLLATLPASPLHNMPASDLRDQEAIQTWVNSLATKL